MILKNAYIGLPAIGSIIVLSLTLSTRSAAQEVVTFTHLPLVMKSYPIVETGQIAFVSARDGNDEIYRMGYDGIGATRLTYNTYEDLSPDWSPDGTQISFMSNETGEYEIYVMNADGTGRTQITTMTHCYTPRWSPDGNRIVFYTRPGSDNIIYTMNPDGSGLVQVTDPAVSGYDPYWSPDGFRIAYQSIRGVAGIYVVDPDGSNTALLYAGPRLVNFAWSPDGDHLALSIWDGSFYNYFDIYIYDLNTSTLYRITNNQNANQGVDWSPDGHYLIYHAMEAYTSQIYTMTVAGDHLTNITEDPVGAMSGDWGR